MGHRFFSDDFSDALGEAARRRNVNPGLAAAVDEFALAVVMDGDMRRARANPAALKPALAEAVVKFLDALPAGHEGGPARG